MRVKPRDEEWTDDMDGPPWVELQLRGNGSGGEGERQGGNGGNPCGASGRGGWGGWGLMGAGEGDRVMGLKAFWQILNRKGRDR